MKISYLVIFMAFLFLLSLAVVHPQNVENNNEEQRFFDITDTDLPGHCVNLLFAKMEKSERNLLYWRIASFLLARAIRKKWKEICDAEKVARNAAVKRQGSAKQRAKNERGKKKKMTTTATTETTSSAGWTQEQLEEFKKLAEVELDTYLKEKVVCKQEIVERIAEIWMFFKSGGSWEKVPMISDGGQNECEKTQEEMKYPLWTEIQAVNMEAIKPLLLVGKYKDANSIDNELAKAFEECLFKTEEDGAVFFAKKTLRRVVGERMFAELELQEPMLLRLDMIEDTQLIELYKQAFSTASMPKQPLVQLEISSIFAGIFYFSAMCYGRDYKEVLYLWYKKVLKSCSAGSGASKELALDKVLKNFKEKYTILTDQLNKDPNMRMLVLGMKYMEVEKRTRNEHIKTLERLYTTMEGNNTFRQFLNVTPGARARVHKFLSPNTPDALLHFDLDESAMLEQMAVNYAAAVNFTKSELRLKAHLTVDLLVQLHWLDEHFGNPETDQKWHTCRDLFLLFVDQFVDGSKQFMQLYGTSCNNMLFGLIQAVEANDHREIVEYFTEIANIKQMVKEEKLKITGANPKFTDIQAQWLPSVHLKILKRILLSYKEGKGAADTDESEAINGLRNLKPEKVKRLADLLLTGKNAHQKEAFVELFEKGRKRQPLGLGSEKETSSTINELEKQKLHDVSTDDEKEVEQPQIRKEFKEEEKVTNKIIEENLEEQETEQKVVKNNTFSRELLSETKEIGPPTGGGLLTEYEFKMLVENYMKLLEEISTELDRLKAHTVVDVMVQLHWLDAKFAREQAQRLSGTGVSFLLDDQRGLEYAKWTLAREQFVTFLQQMEEKGHNFVQSYSIIFNNMLFKLVKGKEHFLKLMNTLDGLVKAKESALAGHDIVGHVSLLDEESRASWMANEHRMVLERLRAEGRIRDLNRIELEHLATLLGVNHSNEQDLALLRGIFGSQKDQEEVKKEEMMEMMETKQMKENAADEARKRKGKAHSMIEKMEEEQEEKQQHQQLSDHDDDNDNDADDEWYDTDRLLDKLAKLYLEAIAENSTEQQRQRAKAAANVLVQMLWRNEFSNYQATSLGLVHEEWVRNRMSFVQFLHQLEEGEGDEEWVEKSAKLYGNMLYKLHWHDGQERWEDLMKPELALLERFKECVKEGKPMPAVAPISAQIQAKWLLEEHEKTMKSLSKDMSRDFAEKIAALTPAEIARLQNMFGNKAEMTNKIVEEKADVAKIVDDEKIMDQKVKEKEEKDTNALMTMMDSSEASSKDTNEDGEMDDVFGNFHHVLLECPEPGEGSIPFSHDEPYVRFLFERDTVFWRRDADIGALRWMFMNAMNRVLMAARALLLGNGDDDPSSRVEEELARVKSDWEQLLAKELQAQKEIQQKTGVENIGKKMAMKERTLCQYQAFFWQRILDNNAEHGGEMWKTVLKDAGFTEDLVNFLKLPGMVLLDTTSSCNVKENAAAVVTRLMEYPGRSHAHFVYLNTRIRKSKPFRHFLCRNHSVQHIKDRLLELVDEQALASLETLHPDVLKIGEMHPRVRVHLYREFMKHQSGTVAMINAELRIVFPLLVILLKEFEQEHRFKDKALGEALRQKARWLRLEVFRDPRGLISLANVCRLEIFSVFARSFQISDFVTSKTSSKVGGKSGAKEKGEKSIKNTKNDTNNKKEKKKAKDESKKGDYSKFDSQEAADEVRQWDGVGECENESAQLNMYFEQRRRQLIQTSHHAFIKEHMEQICREAQPGMRARLKDLVPELEELTYDWESYTHVDMLQRLVEESLFANREKEHMAALLGATFVIWARFMDAQLLKRPSSCVALEGEIWLENRAKLLENFDLLFNMSHFILVNMEETIQAKMQDGFYKLFLMKQKVKATFKKKSVEAQLREQRKCKEIMFTELQKNTNKQWDKLWNSVEYMQYIKWAQGNAVEVLQRLLIKRNKAVLEGAFGHDDGLAFSESFHDKLKQGFNDHPVAKRRLPKLIGFLGVEIVAHALGLNNWKPEDLGLKELSMKEEKKKNVPTISSEANSSRTDTMASEHSKTNKEEEANSTASHSMTSAVSKITASKTSKKKRNKAKMRATTPETNEAMDSSTAQHSEPSTQKSEEIETSSQHDKNNRFFALDANLLGKKPLQVIKAHEVLPDPTLALEPGWELPKESRKNQQAKVEIREYEADEMTRGSDENSDQKPLEAKKGENLVEMILSEINRKSHSKASMLESKEIVALKQSDQFEEKSSEKLNAPNSSPSSINKHSESGLTTTTKAEKTSKPSKPMSPRRGEQAEATGTSKLTGEKKEESEHFDNLHRPIQARTHVWQSRPSQVLDRTKLWRPVVHPNLSTNQQNKQQRLHSSEDDEDSSQGSKVSEMPKASEVQPQTVTSQLSLSSVKTKANEEQVKKGYHPHMTTGPSKVISQGKRKGKTAWEHRLQIEVPKRPLPGLLEKLKKEGLEKLKKEAIDPIEPLRALLREKGYLLESSFLVPPPQPSIIFGTIEPKQAAVKLTTQQAIEELETVLRDWTQIHQMREATLLFSGSYLLELHTVDSDIDCVVLLPFEESKADDWKFLYKEKIFGNKIITNSQTNEIVLCDLESGRRHCPDSNWSLYCMLCWDQSVTALHKLNVRNKIPMITMKFHDFDFDLLFVTMPTVITDKLIDDEWKSTDRPFEKSVMLKQLLTSLPNVDKMIGTFIEWMGKLLATDECKSMLLAMSGYRANLLIRDLLAERPKYRIKFKLTYLALKLWTKNHFIYGGKFGLLNGTTLTLLLLKVFLKHSNDSVPDLLFHFFETYSNWKWPDPVELDEAVSQRALDTSSSFPDWQGPEEEKLRRDHFRLYSGCSYLTEHAKLVWPVIVPGFPTQNAAFNVNAWTKQAMQTEFDKGLTQTDSLRRQIQAAASSEMIRREWAQWLDGGSFDQKYDHFVAIVCAAQSIQQMRTFCDYVEIRIRLQLLFAFGDLSEVKWIHANPEKVRSREAGACPSGEEAHLPAGNKNWLCTVWLVGIQLVDDDMEQKDNIQHVLEERLEKMDFADGKMRSRSEDFAHKIFKSFKSFKRQGSFSSSPRNLASPHNSAPFDSPTTSLSAASLSPAGVAITEQKEKVWTKYLAREQLHAWLPVEIPR